MATMMILDQNQSLNKNWAVIFIIALGWLFGAITTHILKPEPPVSIEAYQLFFITCIILRIILFAVSLLALYLVRGSILIWVLMGFNLTAIFLNLAYLELDSLNVAQVNGWRVRYFSITYKALELIIIVKTGWGVRNSLFYFVGHFFRSIRSMALGWNLLYQGSAK